MNNSEENNEIEKLISNWGGKLDKHPDAELSPEDIFDVIDAEAVAKQDIESEYGEEEFAPLGSLEDPKILSKLHEENKLRKKIQKMIAESNVFQEEAEELGEERIANPKAKKNVDNLENFIGSHIYGEDLGGLGKMYVAYSYGEHFPVYVNNKGKWYHNTDTYDYKGEINDATEKHKEDMRPSKGTSGMSLRGLQSMINGFKKKNGIKSTNHKDVEPGEKN